MKPPKWQHVALLVTLVAVTTPIISATVEPQLLDIYRYFVDQSNLSRWCACSEREHECLERDQLLFEEDGQCYTVGERGPCQPHETFHADKEEVNRSGGHMRGICSTGCKHSKAPLAATGQCMSREEVERQVCRKEWYLAPTKDVFGQWVCKWTKLPCSLPTYPHRTSSRKESNRKPYTGVCFIPETILGVGTNDIEDSSDPLFSVAPVDHPWLQFFANESYLDREFSCTEEEKTCLQFGRVLRSDGDCHRLNGWPNICKQGESFHLDWDEAMREGGSLRGTCRSRCPRSLKPQGRTQKCTNECNVATQICRPQWGMVPTEDWFGQLVCKCSQEDPSQSRPPPKLPPPAATPGHCRAPDFSNPILPPRRDITLTLGFRLPCSEEEFACLREGRVLAGGACHALRTQGPCAEGEELLLDKEALAHQRLAIVCKARPCPKGSVLLPTDDKCLTPKQISALCEKVTLDVFGGWHCEYEDNWSGNLTRIIRHSGNGTCEMAAQYGEPHFLNAFTRAPVQRASEPTTTIPAALQ